MDAKELRLGNLIYKLGKNVIKVEFETFRNVDAMMFPYDPIPLSEEWVLKLGFESKFGGEFEKGRFTYRIQQRDLIIEGFEYDYNGIIAHVEYVHQLQNLYFALTKEELLQ